MTQNERELLVEKYLAGDMNAAEESDFFINVALDNNLQQSLRAQRTLHRALASDMRNAVPQQASYRTNIMALLASTQVIGGADAGVGVSGAGASGVSGAGAAGVAATGTIFTKVILGTAVGLSLAGGTLYLTGQFDSTNQPTIPNIAPVQRQLEVLPQQIQPPTLMPATPTAQPATAAKPAKRTTAPTTEATPEVNLDNFKNGDQTVTLQQTTSTQNGKIEVNQPK